MEDNQFDDILRDKLEGFEGGSFDPTALASLHHTMAATNSIPFYVRYGREIFYSTLVILLSTGLFFSQWHFFHSQQDLDKSQFAQLESQYLDLKNKQQVLIDSLEGWTSETETDNNDELSRLKKHISNLEIQISGLIGEQKKAGALLTQIDQKKAEPTKYMAYHPTNGNFEIPTDLYISEIQFEHHSPFPIVRKNDSTIQSTPDYGGSKISLSDLAEIEKHYHRGIGIKLGPMVEATGITFPKGSGESYLSTGLLVDLILSSKWSLESGLIYRSNYFEIQGSSKIDQLPFPYKPQSAQPVDKAEVDSRMIAIPLMLKYRYPLGDKTKINVGAGYSHLLYFNQEYEYTLQNTEGSDISSRSDKKVHNLKNYPGGIHLYGGLSHQLKNGNALEVGPYYEIGMGKKGLEANEYSTFGLRGVLWFPVKE